MVPLFGSEMKLLGTIKSPETQKLANHELGPVEIATFQQKESNGNSDASMSDSDTQNDNGVSHLPRKSTVLHRSANN
jgi:hypothetical protein